MQGVYSTVDSQKSREDGMVVTQPAVIGVVSLTCIHQARIYGQDSHECTAYSYLVSWLLLYVRQKGSEKGTVQKVCFKSKHETSQS